MIVFQSVACANKESSPKGCGRLAGDNIPGHQPNDHCALKGRRKEPISFARSPAPVGICGIRYGACGIVLIRAFEPIGNRREEYGEAIGRMAAERAGANESIRVKTRSL